MTRAVSKKSVPNKKNPLREIARPFQKMPMKELDYLLIGLLVAVIVIVVIVIFIDSASPNTAITQPVGNKNSTIPTNSTQHVSTSTLALSGNGCSLSGLSVRISNSLGNVITLQRMWALSGSGFQTGISFPVTSKDFNMTTVANGGAALLYFDYALYCPYSGSYTADIVLEYTENGNTVNSSATEVYG